MRSLQLTKAEKAWLGLFVYVVIADGYLMRAQNDTMSICYGKWLEQQRSRRVCIALTALMIAHLHWRAPLPGQKILRRIATLKTKNQTIGVYEIQ